MVTRLEELKLIEKGLTPLGLRPSSENLECERHAAIRTSCTHDKERDRVATRAK